MSSPQVERFLLFVEEQSRYDNHLGMALPSELPDDGLRRVVVDHDHAARVDPQELSQARTDADRIAFLTAETPLRNYTRVIGRAAAQLAGTGARLWCVGEMSRSFAAVLPEAAGMEVAVLRANIVSSIVAFRISPEKITDRTVWPFFSNDYGARLFAFQQPNTPLEKRLIQLKKVLRRDASAVAEEWRRGDWERTVRRALAERDEVLVYSDEEGRPPAAQEAAHLWREIQEDCWHRDRLHGLCSEALFCVLPDGTHNGTVSFHANQLTTKPIVEALIAAVHAQGAACSIISYVDEYR